MAHEAISRRPGGVRLRGVRWAFLVSRGLVLGVAVGAAALFDPDSSRNADLYDVPFLTHPLGGVGDALLSPLARWDSVWYLSIAHDGYGSANAAFFPLYPLLVRVVAGFSASPGALLISAYAVSLAAFAGALALLHRLAELELGRGMGRPAVLLLALFPLSFFFGAPYSESLFLLLSVGAFYAARTGRWAWAGGLAAGASATRSAGIVLLVPLLIMYLRGPRRDRSALWLALAPAGLVAYTVYLALAEGDGFAYLHLQEVWFRHFAGPFVGAWDGAVAAFDGARQLLSGSRHPVYFDEAGGDPYVVGIRNLALFGSLILAAVATVGVIRRLPAAHGAYVVSALALPLSFPVSPQPLMSLPRFLAVLFPLFLWLALVCEERRITAWVLTGQAALLIVLTALFADWRFVA
jgi:hypothetical protein